jgi:hypothetical protein
MSKQPEIGTKHPSFDAPKLKLKPVALVQLIATMTLALSTLIVAIAVTIGGLARVDVAPTMTGADAVPFAITHSPTNRAA